MAYNKVLTDKVRKSLTGLCKFEEKKMFRGITFMVNDKMCVSVGDDEMLCRIDPELHNTTIKQNGCRPMMMKGREYKGYVYIREDFLSTERSRFYWIKLALDFNKKICKKEPIMNLKNK